MKTILSIPVRKFRISPISYWARAVFVWLLCGSVSTVALGQAEVWKKTFGGNAHDNLQAVLATADGGYLLGGSSDSGISGSKTSPNKGGTDYWIIKTDRAGTKLWEKTYGGSGNDELTAIVSTPDGGFLLGGSSASGISGDKTQANRGVFNDYWVVKIDATGLKQWDKTLGGNHQDELMSLLTTADGGYLLGGVSSSENTGDKSQSGRGGKDYWAVKIDAAGTKVWDRTFGGINMEYGIVAMTTAPDGGYILGGTSASSIGGDKSEVSRGEYGYADYWIIKINTNGSKVWDKTIGGTFPDRLGKVIATPDGGYILGGDSESEIGGEKSVSLISNEDYWIVKVNGSGSKIWDRAFASKEMQSLGDLIATPDGGYLIGGHAAYTKHASWHYVYDFFTVKIDATGNEAWRKTYNVNYEVNDLQALTTTSDGGFILAGTSMAYTTVPNDIGEEDVFYEPSNFRLLKISGSTPLTTQWNVGFGGTGTDKFTQVIRTPDGGYLTAGVSSSGANGDKTQSSQGGYDIWVAKTNAAGTKVWDKRYGGAANEYLNSIIPTQDGGFLLGGSSESGLSGDKSQSSQGGTDFWIVKINRNGIKEWDKRFGGTGYDYLNKVIQLNTGDYVLAGVSNSPISGDKSQSSRGGLDQWIVKITSSGAKIWDNRFGGALNEYVEGLVKIPEGGYLVAGYSASNAEGDKSQASRGGYDFWVTKVSTSGAKVWDKRFGGALDDKLMALIRTSDGNYLLGGYSVSNTGGDKSQANQGSSDFWTVKINGSGTKLWDKTYGGLGNDQMAAISQAPDGGYIVGGQSVSGVSGSKSQPNRGGKDFWVLKTNSNGVILWDQRLGGSGTEDLRTVLATADGGYLLGGSSASGATGDKTQASRGGTDFWVIKVSPAGVAATAIPVIAASTRYEPKEESPAIAALDLRTFPNPFTDRVTIAINVPETQTVKVSVYDSQGSLVAPVFNAEVKAGKAHEVEWRPSAGQAAGIYIVRLQTADQVKQQKVILAR